VVIVRAFVLGRSADGELKGLRLVNRHCQRDTLCNERCPPANHLGVKRIARVIKRGVHFGDHHLDLDNPLVGSRARAE